MLDGFDSEEIDSEVIDAKIITESDRAVLIESKGRTAWFPKSVLINVDNDAIEYEAWFDLKWSSNATNKVKAIEGDFI